MDFMDLLESNRVEEDMRFIDKLSIQQIKHLGYLLSISVGIFLPIIIEYYLKFNNWMVAIFITFLTFISIYSSFSWLQCKIEFRKLYKTPMIRDYHHPELLIVKWISKHNIKNKEGDTLTNQTWIVKSEDKPIDTFPYFICSAIDKPPIIIKTTGCSLIRKEKDDNIIDEKIKAYAYDLKFKVPISKKETKIELKFNEFKTKPSDEENTTQIQITHKTKDSEYEIILPHKSTLLFTSLKDELGNTIQGCTTTEKGFICKIEKPESLVTYRVIYQWQPIKK